MKTEFIIDKFDKLSPKEQQMVDKFEQLILPDLADFPDLQNQWNYIRFLKARNFDIKKSKEMLLRFLNFRREQNYDRIMTKKYTDYDIIWQNHSSGFCNFDYEGRLIAIEKVSESKVDLIMTDANDQNVRDFLI